MKILAHHPRRTTSTHIVRSVGGSWKTLCSARISPGRQTAAGEWRLEDCELAMIRYFCMNCQALESAMSNPAPARPPLPCSDPERIVTLWTRQDDDRALVHSCMSPQADKARCGVKNPDYAPERWTATAAQKAGLITCKFCLRAEGLYEGELRPQRRPRPKSAAAHRDLLDLWYKTQGVYHHSDPRAVGE